MGLLLSVLRIALLIRVPLCPGLVLCLGGRMDVRGLRQSF